MAKTKSIRQWRRSCLADKGDQEHPLGSNNTKYGEEFGENGVAWCVIYCYLKYLAAGVVLPLKTAGCVALYDACIRAGLHYTSDHCVPGDSVIRTWQELSRNAAGFDPQQTHCQEVLKVKKIAGVKYLGLWGGNQGAGYVGPAIEWVRAGDPSILGGLAFHRLFAKPQPPEPTTPKKTPAKQLPAAKSHKYPKLVHRTPRPRRPWYWRFLIWSRW